MGLLRSRGSRPELLVRHSFGLAVVRLQAATQPQKHVEAIERDRVRHIERKRKYVIVRCVLFHLIVPLFIVVGNVNSLPFLGYNSSKILTTKDNIPRYP